MGGDRGRLGPLLVIVGLIASLALAGCTLPRSPTPTAAANAPPPTAVPTSTPASMPTTTPAPTATSTTAVGSPTPQAQAEPAGTLEVLLPSLGNGRWTHLFAVPAAVRQYSDPVYNYLFRLAADWPVTAKYEGELVESFEVSRDAREYRFRLRKGVMFHGGYGELTAEDVRFTFDQYASGDVVAGAAGLGKDIYSFNIDNPYEFTLRFNSPHPSLVYDLSNESGQWPILSKRHVAGEGRERADQFPIGTGQYQLREQTGAYITLEVAPGKHFLGAPDFKQIRFRAIPDEITRLALLKTGEADIVPITRVSVPAVKAVRGAKVIEMPYYTLVEVALGGLQAQGGKQFDAAVSRKDPWADARVRQAMNLAIDKQGIIEGLFFGSGRQATNPSILKGWDKLSPTNHDAAKAQTLLREAGFEKGFPIKLLSVAISDSPQIPEMPRVLEAVAAMWARVGIQPKIESIDAESFRALVGAGKTAGIGYSWRDVQRAEMEHSAQRHYGKEGSQVVFQDPAVFDILQGWRVATDPAARLAAEQKLAVYLHDQYAAIPIAMLPSLAAVSSKVASWPNPVNGDYPRGFAGIKAAR